MVGPRNGSMHTVTTLDHATTEIGPRERTCKHGASRKTQSFKRNLHEASGLADVQRTGAPDLQDVKYETGYLHHQNTTDKCQFGLRHPHLSDVGGEVVIKTLLCKRRQKHLFEMDTRGSLDKISAIPRSQPDPGNVPQIVSLQDAKKKQRLTLLMQCPSSRG